MMLKKLPVIAASAALSFWACGEDSSIMNPYGGAYAPAGTSSSSDAFGIESSSGALDIDVEIWSSSNGALPGNVVSSSSVTSGNVVSSSSVVLNIGASSSSNVIPVVSSSSNNAVPGSSESGDNENDNEDARTLDGTQILLKLAGTSATVENNNGCVEIADKSATITCPGAYYVTGESSDFQVVVNTPGAKNEGNTGIYLHNATIKSTHAPILVKNADKTVLHLVKGTTNVVEDGNGNHLFTTVNGKQDTAKAAIYSKDDLNIKGAGKLTVTGKFKNGIQSSNDLKIKNGDITVVANDNGIKGKGSLHISGGTLNVTAKAGDGLESDECVENQDGSFKDTVATKGIVKITGGNITIKAGDDGISAANYVTVNDSTEKSTIKITATDKGLAAEKFIYVDGGDININADDDALHTHWQVLMNGGNVEISAKKKGIHADSAIYLKGSTINVATSYEAIEAYEIFAEGGVTSVFATNDGWNAAGGPKNPNSSMAMFSESSGNIVISGGYHYISIKGNMVDGLDANGTGKMTGGVVIVEITGQSYENGMGGGGFNFGGGMGGGFNFGGGMGGGFNFGGGGGWGGQQGGSDCGAYNFAGGLVDTDDGFTITGGVLLAFGNYTMDVPGCTALTYNSSNYYGSDKAAFKPTYQGNYIIYGGEVKSAAQVQTSGMKEFKFPNGVSYMYK
ncbi:carbohydrate-binding domain-containing protein [Fibrobacter sp.]|uniref:carbohydrate-binding domain-containing protein n=1 Tax=Fibrobacter sp. TaxID=35828 RepID=UPI00386CDCE2